MSRIIVDDNASGVYAATLEDRIQALESGAEDEGGHRVTITADQVLTSGTEIGGITIGMNRTAFYAPSVGDLNAKLNKPANDGTNGQVLATNGAGGTYWTNNDSGGGSTGGSTVTVTRYLSSGTRIATVTVDGNGTDLYAPNDGGSDEPVVIEDGPLPLLNTVTLGEDVSSIIISEDANGDELNIENGFYIEAEFKQASADRAQAFTVSVGGADSETNVPLFSANTIPTTGDNYADVYARQIAPNRWLVESRVKAAMYDAASGTGTGIGQLNYNNWNGFNNPPATIKRVAIGYNTKKYGKNTVICLYGR